MRGLCSGQHPGMQAEGNSTLTPYFHDCQEHAQIQTRFSLKLLLKNVSYPFHLYFLGQNRSWGHGCVHQACNKGLGYIILLQGVSMKGWTPNIGNITPVSHTWITVYVAILILPGFPEEPFHGSRSDCACSLLRAFRGTPSLTR